MQISVGFKLIIARFCNSTLVILGVNIITSDYSSENLFDGENLAYDIFLSSIINCYLDIFLLFLDKNYY